MRAAAGREFAAIVLLGASLAAVVPHPSEAQVSRTGEGEIPGVIDEAGMRARLEAALTRDPGDIDAWASLARLELFGGDTLRAETLLREGIRGTAGDPRVIELQGGLLEVLALRARWGAADSVVAAMALPVAEEPTPGLNALGARVRFNVGVEARLEGDADRALRAWLGATAIDPGLREAWREAARMQLVMADTAAARATLEAARIRHPDDAELRLLEASTLGGDARAEAETSALRDLRRARPDDEEVGLALASRLAGNMELEAALALHDSLLAGPDPSAVAYAQVGRFWLRYGSADSAIGVLETGVRRHPDDVVLAVLVGAAAERLDPPDPRRSGAAYQRAGDLLAEEPDAAIDDVWLRVRAAATFAEAGAVEEARAALAALVSRRLSTDAAVQAAEIAEGAGLRQLARNLLGRGGGPGAISVLDLTRREAALLLEDASASASSDAWRELALEGSALAALELGEAATREEASAGLRGSLVRIGEFERRIVSNDGTGMLRDADPIAIARGDDLKTRFASRLVETERARAEELLERVVLQTEWGARELERLRGLYPTSPLLGQVAVRAALRRGDPTAARSEVERLLDRYPAEAAIHALDARTREALGEDAEAVASWTRALELDARCEAAFEALVAARTRDGRLADLLDRIRRLRRIEPQEPRRWSHEVEILHRLDRLDEAAAVAESARAVAEESPDRAGEAPAAGCDA